MDVYIDYLKASRFKELIKGTKEVYLRDNFWNIHNYSNALLKIIRYINENKKCDLILKFKQDLESIFQSKELNPIDNGLLSLHIIKEIKILCKYFPELEIESIVDDDFLLNAIKNIEACLTDREKEVSFYHRDVNELNDYLPIDQSFS